MLQGGIVSFAVLAGVVAIAVLLLTSTMNAAIASFLMSISMVGVFMTFFFSSVTVIYMGAIGFGGLTISSIAFLSVCAVIFFSGELSRVLSYEPVFCKMLGVFFWSHVPLLKRAFVVVSKQLDFLWLQHVLEMYDSAGKRIPNKAFKLSSNST